MIVKFTYVHKNFLAGKSAAVLFKGTIPLGPFRIFSKICGDIPPVANLPLVSRLPPVSTTPAANLPLVSTKQEENFATSFASVVDTSGKFAAGFVDTGGKQ
jgi:hypothetical protein